jgi:hypothetical protein
MSVEACLDRRMVLALDRIAVVEENTITIWIQGQGWHQWHWLPCVWLLAGVPGELTPRSLWDEIRGLPGLYQVRGVVFTLSDPPVFWGNNAKESWQWMQQFWGQAAKH